MKPRLLKYAYEFDGFIFETINHDDWSKIFKVLGLSSSASEAINTLKQKNVSVNVYKVERR